MYTKFLHIKNIFYNKKTDNFCNTSTFDKQHIFLEYKTLGKIKRLNTTAYWLNSQTNKNNKRV